MRIKINSEKIKILKILLPLIAVLTVILLLSLNFLNGQKGQVVAKVNGKKIYRSEVEHRLKEIFQNSHSQPVQLEKLPIEFVKTLVKDVYAEKKLDDRAKKSQLILNSEIKEKINDYAKKIERREYINSLVKNKTNDEAVKNKYVELVTDLSGKRAVHLRHILVKNKSETQDILKQIKAKKSFPELAKKYSIDTATAADGGDLGFVIEDNLLPEFFDFASDAKSGAVSNPIKTNYGWHIVKIEEFRDVEVPPFESVKTIIEEQLRKDEIKKIYSDIADSAKVKILINLEGAAK